jgi:hypothetical protein
MADTASTIDFNGIRYMTLKEYSRWKNVSYWTTRRQVKAGTVKTELIGHCLRIPVEVRREEATA